MVTVWGKGSSNFGLCYSLLNKKKPKPEGIKRNLTNFLSCTWEENYMVNPATYANFRNTGFDPVPGSHTQSIPCLA